jgi:hypothetical protein
MNINETPFKEFILKDKSWMSNLFKNTTIYNESGLLLTDETPYIVCSDGGLKDNRDGFGLIVQRNNKIVLQNQCRIPMVYENLSSHRREGFGIISALAHLTQLQLYKERNKNMTPLCATIVCDNMAIVTITQSNMKYKTKPKKLLST